MDCKDKDSTQMTRMERICTDFNPFYDQSDPHY